MEKLSFGNKEENLSEFSLTIEQMITIKGGETSNDPIFKPYPPPVQI